MAEFLALLDVRNVHLDGGFARGRQGVPQGDARVRIRAEVYDERSDTRIGQGVNLIHQRTFVSGLKKGGGETAGLGLGADQFLEVLERGPSIDLRFAFPEPVEVGSVEYGDLFNGGSERVVGGNKLPRQVVFCRELGG